MEPCYEFCYYQCGWNSDEGGALKGIPFGYNVIKIKRAGLKSIGPFDFIKLHSAGMLKTKFPSMRKAI